MQIQSSSQISASNSREMSREKYSMVDHTENGNMSDTFNISELNMCINNAD